jgi:dihydroorotase
MLVDNEQTLEAIFSKVPMLIATHCEDESTIRKNKALFKARFGDDIPVQYHPEIRSEEACYLSSSLAVRLAKKYASRLHVLHISTAKETQLFSNDIPLAEKKITAEACIHHLWFSDEDYPEKGNLIKWNPAVKTANDRAAIWKAVLDNRIDVIATDHAPHTLEEKNKSYFDAPSGGPLVQHALLALFEKQKQGQLSLEQLVQKTAHNPAILFRIQNRGFIRESYFADLVIVNPNKKNTVEKSNILAKCAWSPFEGYTFSHKIDATFVNGELVWNGDEICSTAIGKRLLFQHT